jgi:preprotein translocase subunit SecG
MNPGYRAFGEQGSLGVLFSFILFFAVTFLAITFLLSSQSNYNNIITLSHPHHNPIPSNLL